MIKVSNKVTVYEINGQETTKQDETIGVESHWNRNEMVVLIVCDKRITVAARDIEAAIKNATNSARF